VQDDNVSVTANGVARQDGALGDTIQVHRDGIMTDITVTVIDVRTVQLEI
jgi:flagella basal body P-ring formation protein FlgA